MKVFHLYNGIIICDRGFEKECAEELRQLVVAQDVITAEAVVTFSVADRSDLLLLCYRMQTAVKVLEGLGSVAFDAASIVSACARFVSRREAVAPWIVGGRTFKIVTRFDQDETGLDLLTVAAAVGSEVIKAYPDAKVDVKNPQTIICVYVIGDVLYCGIDYSHENLAKREYKIFLNPTALRATVAAGLVRAAGFGAKKTLLDPFNGTGTIAIEAGFMLAQQSPMYYKKEYLPLSSYPFFTEQEALAFLTKLDEGRVELGSHQIFGFDLIGKNVDASKKNAKIAGVLDAIHFAKVEVDWIDLKLPQDGIDCIISAPPLYRDAVPKEHVDKAYKQLFNRSQEILARTGVMVLLVNQPNTVQALLPPVYKCVESRAVWMGQTSLFLLKIVWA